MMRGDNMTPQDRKFTKTHEWVKIEGKTAIIGLTDYAQDSLGDITFIELPPVRKKIVKGKGCCVIESVKAASDIYAPVSGEVIAVNKDLESHPENINSDPYGNAWIMKINNFTEGEVNDLMDAAAYDAFLESEA
jgi:glycine cleavage system H protein